MIEVKVYLTVQLPDDLEDPEGELMFEINTAVDLLGGYVVDAEVK